MSAAPLGSDLLEETLARLSDARRAARPREVEEALALSARAAPPDPAALVRLHDLLLFHRAHPRSRKAVALAERALARIPGQVERLAREGYDLSLLDAHETAGIGGSTVSMTFGYDAVRWLMRRFPRALSIDWEVHDAPEALERVLPRLVPLAAEEALADVGVDHRAWLDAARAGKETDLAFLLSRLDALDEDPRTRALLWDTLQLQVSWRLGREPASRTLARWPYRPFVLEEAFARRRGVSLADEAVRPPRLRRLSAAAGARAVDLCRAAVLCRYREVYAFTHGDPRAAWEADLGRGAALLVCGIVKERRLPMRAGFGYLLLRNGVPVGYGDAYALGEKLDLSFNVFYAFRDGESAFLYARAVSAFGALLGARVYRGDPYQVGKENEEAVASGAFFFYRRLGFHSADPRVEALASLEERRNAADPGRRTSAAALRRLGSSAVLWAARPEDARAWARFSVRELAAKAMGGSRDAAAAVRALGKRKGAADEAAYARALAADSRLRASLLRLGSS